LRLFSSERSSCLLVVLVSAIVGGGATVLLPGAAHAAALEATLIAEHSTSTWGRPSPDPAGISYDPGNNRLILSDSEVDEMPLYAGTNVFFSSLDGIQDAANPGWTTEPWSYEPSGISFQNAGRVFVSDDDQDKVFLVDTGADGLPIPGVSTESFSTRPLHGDAEDVTVDMDAANGHLLVIDGHDSDVHDYGPGPNGVFDGVPPVGGDDTVVTFDVGQYGALDPEGIEYYPSRDTLLVLDSGSKSVYELDRRGALVNVVSIAAGRPKSAAGITLAPASDGSGAQHVYIVDRGVDNDTNAAENDGRFYEMALNLPPVESGGMNTAPAVSAGPDLTVILPDAATLTGSVTDDGRPAGAAVATRWTAFAGPGTVAFSSPDQAQTTATFSAPGGYLLRLTGSDGQLAAYDDVSVVVGDGSTPGAGPLSLDLPVRSGVDDAEERSGSTSVSGNDLELVTDGTTVQTVGVRFTGVAVPQGSVVTKAHLLFQVDEVTTGPTSLTVAGQAADDTAAFTTAARDISQRPQTSARVSWEPAPWSTVGARGADQQTPDLTAVLQEIVSRPGWVSGNAATLVLTGTGTRTAEAYEGAAGSSAVLHLEFEPPAGGGGATNVAPSVNAGPDLSVVRPDAATLAGSVSDDGLPTGSSVTAAWLQVSGPGTAVFAQPDQASTAATFSAPGDYVLRLTGSDGELEQGDEVTVAVSDPPPATGPSGAIEVPVQAGADDAEERSGGATAVTGADLELIQDGRKTQTVGLRFAGVSVPVGATVTSAYVQFQTDEVTTAAASLTVAGQAADEPLSFTSASGDISSRPRTGATVGWTPAPWTNIGFRGPDQQTPDLSAVVQEIVSRPGWASGNALVLVVTGTGTRTAEAYEGGAPKAPVLHVEFGGGAGGVGTGGSGGGGAPPLTLSVPIGAGVDDAEERAGGSADVSSGDLELIQDGTKAQTVGLRFAGVSLPAGATVISAYVQFQTDEATTAAVSLTIAGQAADDSPSFASVVGNISSRPRTAAAVAWSPGAWSTVGARSNDQRTPDLSPVVAEIASRPGWTSGSAIVLIVTGTGTRTAEAYEGGATKAPVLHIQYTIP
jgi:hypothetical protein